MLPDICHALPFVIYVADAGAVVTPTTLSAVCRAVAIFSPRLRLRSATPLSTFRQLAIYRHFASRRLRDAMPTCFRRYDAATIISPR